MKDGSEWVGAHRRCFKEAMQDGWKHLTKRIECVGFQMKAIPLRAVPRAEIPLKHFDVDMSATERLGKAKAAKTGANN